MTARPLPRSGPAMPDSKPMADDSKLQRLDSDLPAQPEALVKLSLLMAADDIDLKAASALIESDMALAAAMMKAVDSSLYGLKKGRVQTVLQAVQYLGLREVAAITYAIGLRAAFAPTPELEPIWQRAARRGLIMGRLGQRLGVDAWTAHSAGLFEECGKALLLRHAPAQYPAMLRAAAGDDAQLVLREHEAFGASHDVLGAALCQSWGLAAAAADSVRHHLAARGGAALPTGLAKPAVLALSAVAHAMLVGDDVAAVVLRLAPQVPFGEALALRAAREVQQQIGTATAASA
jgi:HD-like signal output (HDOD) protein